MDERSVGAVALHATGNVQGTWAFMSLETGRKISCRNWTPMPMPRDAIDRVRALASADKPGLLFRDRNGQPLDAGDVEDDDESYDPANDDKDEEDEPLDPEDYDPRRCRGR